MMLLVIIVLVALAVSALCSILEASFLSVSTVELTRRKEQGDKGAAILLDLKENRVDDAIGAILTYNTIAHTVGAALAGAQAARVFGDAWIGVFSGVLTLLILVFTEIIPKTLGTVKASGFVGFTGRILSVMVMPPMKWLLVVTRALTHLIARRDEATTTRGDVAAMVKIAERDGAIAGDESKFLANFLRFEEIGIRDVMTPRTVLFLLDAATPLGQVVGKKQTPAFSRIPVYKGQKDNIVGYVLIRSLLEAALEDPDTEVTVESLVRPVVFVQESTTVGRALEILVHGGEHFAVVMDELGVLSGLVSLEDLFETALGREIVDEFDQVADLRQAALELRDLRLAKLRTRWQHAKTSE